MSCALSSKLLLFKNRFVNQFKAACLGAYLIGFQDGLEDFCRCFNLTSMFDLIYMEIVQ